LGAHALFEAALELLEIAAFGLLGESGKLLERITLGLFLHLTIIKRTSL
jgi:hypothetical protein